MKAYTLLPLICILLLGSCVKDKPQAPGTTSVDINADTKVLIINEGNYGWGNASISLFDPSSGNVTEDYYRQQNSNAALGDVCQSITKYNNSYYLVINNSNKVIVAGAGDLKKTATITGFNSPRYMLPVTYNKAYVSDLYSNSIQVLDLNTNTISKSINCKGWTEEMTLLYNKAFVTNTQSDYCYVLNTITDLITDSIQVGKGASSVLSDKDSKIWILTSGESSTSNYGKLIRVDPLTLQVELSLSFGAGDSPSKLCINKTRDTLYYLNKGIYRFPVTQTQIPSSAFVNQGSKIYYGLGVNPKDFTIYASDVIDYVQKSKIEVYRPDGSLKTSFNAGIISGGFIFE